VINGSGPAQTASVSNTTNSSFTTIILTTSTGTLFANTTLNITISSILNYYSYKPFNVQLVTYTSDSFAVEKTTSAPVTLSNSAPDTALIASENNPNKINGNTISYVFNIKNPSILQSSDIISIELQLTNNINTQLLYISSTNSCTVNSNPVACTLDLSNSRLLYVPVGSTYAANTTLSVVVSSIILTRSFEPPGNITVRTFEVSGGIRYLISTTTFSPSANSRANLINNARLTIIDNGISSPRLNTPTSFTLSFQLTNILTTGDYIVVNIPDSDWNFQPTTPVIVTDVNTISTMTNSLCSNNNVFCSNFNGDSYIIRVDDRNGTAFPTNTNISFTFPSTVYASTKSWADSYTLLTFNTFTKTNFLIDSSVNSTSNTAAFSLACPNTSTSHCRTCNNTGFCLSCYQPGEGLESGWNYEGYNIRQSTGECVSSCGERYYNLSNTC
jgi:hypothetical protein